RIRSDRAAWRIGVRGEGKTLADAFGALESGVQRVQAFLKQAGFADAEIGLAAISTEEQRKRDEKGQPLPEVIGYELNRTFSVATGDVDRVHQSAGRVTELIRDGVLVTSRPPAYYYTELPKLRIELMSAASADAKTRAEKIAASTGCRLGTLRDASMGVLQVTEPDSTETSDYGMYDTETIVKDVTAVVTATFGVQTE
ncbi:MAG: SIMPL domain-containing protein, partial [Planctomycetota bacterium]